MVFKNVLTFSLVVLVVVAGFVGYFAGSAAVPPPKTVTITTTVGTPTTVTTTVTTKVTEKVTVTVTHTPLPTTSAYITAIAVLVPALAMIRAEVFPIYLPRILICSTRRYNTTCNASVICGYVISRSNHMKNFIIV